MDTSTGKIVTAQMVVTKADGTQIVREVELSSDTKTRILQMTEEN